MKISPQVEGKSPQIGNISNYPQVGGNSEPLIFSVPWGHHKLLIDKFLKAPEKVMFYVQKTVENNWSRTVLDWQIDSNLYERQGKAISNFKRTLPTPQSDLAQQMTKDPYVIDIMGVRQEMQERELEEHLDSPTFPNICWNWARASPTMVTKYTSALEMKISTLTNYSIMCAYIAMS